MKDIVQMVIQELIFNGVRDLDDRLKHPNETSNQRAERRNREKLEQELRQQEYERQLRLENVKRRKENFHYIMQSIGDLPIVVWIGLIALIGLLNFKFSVYIFSNIL